VLIADDAPANAGTYAPLRVSAPERSVVNAAHPAAVVAGNVETSQRIADTLLLALAAATDALPALGQGTMNNLTIGAGGWSYYETIGGGQGASADGPGPSGVHVGMSNTLNTPVEALELEYPLRVRRYELRRDSGGDGRWRGGDGLERSIEVLEDCQLSLLCDRRRHAPPGAHGGAPGALGENLVNGAPVAAKVSLELRAGDLVMLRTPGGGGWGAPAS
jgi:N-methylhydantoinase B